MQKFVRLLALAALLCIPWVTQAQNTLTVADGTQTNSYVPIYGNYVDEYLRCQTLYPASMITSAATSHYMSGGTITQLTYYLSSPAAASWGSANFQIRMLETTATSLSGFADMTDATTVYTGSISGTSSPMVITLDAPFTYNGGNLIIEVNNLTKGSYKSCSFYGISSTGASIYKNNSSAWASITTGNTQDFIPKTTFTFTGGTELSCVPPTDVAVSNLTATGATLSWTDAGNTGATYVVKLGETVLGAATTPAVSISGTTATLSGLTPNTSYSTLTVTADCGGGDQSTAVSVPTFKTPCSAVTVFPWTVDFEDMTANTVPDCWDNSASASATLSSSPGYIWGVYSYSSNKMLRMHNYSVNTGTALINTPPISLPAGAEYVLTFDYAHNATCGAFTVKVSTDGGSTFTDLESYAKGSGSSYSDPGTFTEAPAISLAAYAGQTITLQFFATANYGNGAIFIDNVKIDMPPACTKVTALTRTAITSTTATLTWTDAVNSGATYTATATPAGESEPTVSQTGLTVSEGAGSVTLTGLTPKTAYVFAVTANCDDANAEAATVLGTTLNNETAITAFDITTAAVRRGDAVIDAVNHTVTMPIYYTTSFSSISGSFTLSSGATMKVYDEDDEDWVSVSSMNYLRSYLPAQGTPLTVRIYAEDAAIYQEWTLTLQPEACTSPSTPTLTAERTTIAATWTNADATVTDYQLVCSATRLTTDEALAAATKVDVEDALAYTFTGLERETKYYVYLRSNCGTNSYSTWREDSVTTKGLSFCEDVIVADGTTSLAGGSGARTVPLWGWNTDAAQHSQMLYPASMLTNLVGKTITGMKYFTSSGSISSWNSNSSYPFSATFTLATTTAENLASGWDETEGTAVFTGAFNSDGSIVFTTPFTYTGGNLLVDINMPVRAAYSTVGFYGVTTTNASRNAYGSEMSGSGTIVNFLPKVSFSYCETQAACPAVTELESSAVTEEGATLTWTASTGDYVSGYQVIVSESELDADALTAYSGPYAYEGTATTCTLTDLDAYTLYNIYVRANCTAGGHDDGNSQWATTSLRTLSACGAATGVTAQITAKNAATATWTMTKPEQDKNFTYIVSATPIAAAALDAHTPTGTALAATTVELPGLLNGTEYHFYVRNVCGVGDASPWDSVTFTTYEALPAVTALAASNVAHNAFTVTWSRNAARFADESQWQVAVVAADATPADADWHTTTSMTYIAVGLTATTAYDVYVRPTDGTNVGEAVHIDDITTTAEPSACLTVANGTSTNSYVPFYGLYIDEYTQHSQSVYPAEMLSSLIGKNITSMTFRCSTNKAFGTTSTFMVGTTESDNLSSDFASTTGLTAVYTGSLTSSGNLLTIEFDAPYTYNGGNLLIDFASATTGSYASNNFYGIASTGASRYQGNSSATVQNFLPEVQFCYEQDPDACRDITNVVVSDVTARTARVGWYPAGSETQWQMVYGIEMTAAERDAATPQLVSAFEQQLTGLTPDKSYTVYVRAYCDADNTGAWKATTFSTLESCGMPTLLAADGITGTTATLHATPHATIGTTTSYTFRYWKEGAGVGDTLTAPVSADGSATLTGLRGNTTYFYDVMATCSGNDGGSRWTAPMSFRTACAAITLADLPYNCGFESNELPTTTGYPLPYCWQSYNSLGEGTNSNYPYAYSGNSRTGSRSLYYSLGSADTYADTMIAVLPQIDVASLPMSGVQLVVWGRTGTNTGSATMQIGTMSDPTNRATFHYQRELTVTGNTYQQYKSVFNSVPGTDSYVAILFEKPASGTVSVYLDDVTLRRRLACEEPQQLDYTSANTRAYSAELKWVKSCSSTPEAWLIERSHSTVKDTITATGVSYGTVNADSVFATVAGLEANTYYTFRVAAKINATDTTEFSLAKSLTTLSDADTITAFAISSDTVSRGTAVIDKVAGTVTLPVYYTTDFSALSGTFNLSTGATARMQNETTGEWNIAVGSGSSYSNFSNLRSHLQMGANTVRVRAADTTIYRDWVITLEPEACTSPRGLTLKPERIRMAASWRNPDATVTDYQVVISETALDEAALAAATPTAVSGTSYTFEGLERETEYHVYVRANCGTDSYSSWVHATATTKALTFCEEIVVANGTTTNEYVPLYANYADEAQTVQSLYPASMLTEMVGKEISSLKYYISYGSSDPWGDGTWQVSLGISERTNLSSGLDNSTALTTVYTGNLTASASEGMTITFNTPFTYTGGNLLVQFKLPDGYDYSSCSFYGTSSSSASYVAEVSYGGGAKNFLPKISFQHCESSVACPEVTGIAASDIEEESATVSWEASTGDYATSYKVYYSETALTDPTTGGTLAYEGTALTCGLTGLDPYTLYHVYVQTVCNDGNGHDDGSSTWAEGQFRTLSVCGAPTNVAYEITGKDLGTGNYNATLTWEKTKPAQSNNFSYIISATAIADEALESTTPTATALTAATVALTGLTPATEYHFYVKNDCGADGPSPWDSVSFTTYNAMPAVTDLHTTAITHSAIAIEWERNDAMFANETQWRVAAVAHGTAPAAADWVGPVSVKHHTFLALTAETAYDLYVQPYRDGVEGTSDSLDNVSTTGLPSPCVIAADGTTSNDYVPVYGYYMDADQQNQMIYPAEMLANLNGKTLTSMKFFVSSGSSSGYSGDWGTTNTIMVKLATTTNTTLSGIITDASFSTVFNSTLGATVNTTNGMEITFDQPYTYNGGNLLVQIENEAGNYSSVSFSGISSTGSSYYSYEGWSGTTGSVQNFLPKVQFCYEQDASGCLGVTDLTVSNVTTTTADVNWMPGGMETSWQYVVSTAALSTEELEAATKVTVSNVVEAALTGLTRDADYWFYLRPVCGTDVYGQWTLRQFATAASCGLPTLAAADGIGTTTATLHATAHESIGTASAYTFRYWEAGQEANKTSVTPSATGSAALTGLTPNTTYYYDVKVSCTGTEGDSRWTEPMSFTTLLAPIDLPYSSTFETGHDKEWVLANGTQTNQWAFGTAASTTSNGRGLYISNDGGTTNAYDNGSYSYVYAYSLFNFEAAKQYTLNFDWKCLGENSSSYDYLRVYLAPENATVTAGAPAPYSGWTTLGTLYGQSSWQEAKFIIPAPTSDTTMKVVFYWYNDGSVGSNPPAAIDSVVLRESDKYTVAAVSNSDDEGTALATIAGTGTHYDGSTVSLTATPIYGYHIHQWINAAGDSIRNTDAISFTLTKDTSLTAVYDSNEYQIRGISSNTEWGTVSGTQTVKFNQPVTLTASPATGFSLVHWLDQHDTVAGNALEFTVNAYRDSTFRAVFDTSVYDVTVNVTKNMLNDAMGTVSGAVATKHFRSTTLAATANYGYHFVNWTDEAGSELGSAATLTVSPVSDTVLNANFDYNQYTVSGQSANATMGSVSGTATVDYLTEVTLTASAATGYHFVNWTNAAGVEQGTEETLTVQALRDSVLTANFAVNVYAVNATLNTALMGSVSGTGDVEHFQSTTLTATPATGYHFVNWTNAAGTVLGSSATLAVSPVSDTTVTANFDTNVYNVTVNVNIAEGGSVAGPATVKHFKSGTYTATASNGYHFVNWTNAAGTELGTATTLTVNAVSDTAITANFDTTKAELAWSADAFTGYTLIDFNNWAPTLDNPHGVSVRYGCVEGATPAAGGIIVDAATGVLGMSKSDGTHIHSTTGTFHIYAVHETDAAYFYDSVVYTLTVNQGVIVVLMKSIEEGGTVAFSGTLTDDLTHTYPTGSSLGFVAAGASFDAQATAATGYHFVKWEEGSLADGFTDLYTTAAIHHTLPTDAGSNYGLRAVFDTNVYNVTVNVNSAEKGTVSGPATIKHFLNGTLTATANYGYHFVNWTNAAGTELGTETTLTLTPVSDTTVTANFAPNQYTVRGFSSNDDMGDVSGTATVDYLTPVTLTATANYGYHFEGWDNGATTTSITIAATKDTTVMAEFDYNQYTVTAQSADATMGSASGTATVNYLTPVTLTATPATGYHFTGWVDNDGALKNSNATVTVDALKDTVLTATFAINVYTITLDYDASHGEVFDGTNTLVASQTQYTVDHGTELTFHADHNDGYRFANWNDGGTIYTGRDLTYTATHTATLTANFADAGSGMVTLTMNGTDMGTVSGGGSYHIDSTVTITATPAAHYHFNKWMQGNTAITANPYSFVMEDDIDFMAHFAIDTHTVALSADATMGSASGAGSYTYGTAITLTATPVAHYHFTGWSDGNTANPRQLTVDGDYNLTALFAIDTHTVTLAVNDATMGSVSGAGRYTYGSTAAIAATANYGYHFAGWSNGTTTESSNLVVSSDSTLTATFDYNQYTVAVLSNDPVKGSVSGTATVNYLTPVTLTATVNYGYVFNGWSNGATTETITIVAEKDSTVTALFTIDGYTITAATANAVMGTVSGTAEVEYLGTATLTATANYGYHFVNWTAANGDILGTTETITVTALRDSTITAHFDYNQYAVNGSSANAVMGSVQGSATVNYLTNVTLTAVANYGYHFTGWSNGATTESITLQALKDTAVTALFDYNQYTITAQSATTMQGTASGTATANYLDSVTLTAAPNYGYHFANWTAANGDILGTTAVIDVQVLRDSVVTANFAPNQYTVTVRSTNDTMGSASGSATVDYLGTTTLTATANYGYHFTGWSNGATAESIILTVTKDTTFTASFDYNQYTVSGQSANTMMGSVSGSATVDYLQTVTLTATANYGYHFTGWSNGATDATITVQALSDSVLTATFAVDQYTVTAQSANDTMGSTSGSATVDYLGTATLTATANYGYHFTGWSNGATTEYVILTVTKDTVLTASFDYNQYTVSGQSANTMMGSVSGTATVDYLQTVTLTATANYGYHFTGWSNGATDATITVQALSDSVLTATFAVDQYTVTAQSADATMGSATGSTTVDYLGTATLTATANYGYHFTGWSNGATTESIVISVTKDTVLTASFDYNQYTVSGQSANTMMGSVSGTATVDYLQTVTLTATANYGYHFVSWSNGATTPTITISATQDTLLTATFAASQYTVSALSGNTTMGSVSGSTTVDYMTAVTLTATANYGYHFTGWSNGLTAESIMLMVTSDTVVTASFDYNQYTVTGLSGNSAMGSVSGTATVNYLQTVTLTATPATGYHFVSWSNGATSPTITVTADADKTLTATFAISAFTVTGQSANATMGSVSGTATVDYLQTVTLTATANYGYHFTGWSTGETTETITVTATGDMTVTAYFDYNQYTITGQSDDAETGSVNGSATVDYLSTVTLTAVPAEHYVFVMWTDGNTDNPRTVTATQDSLLTATFTLGSYSVTLTADETMGSVSGAGSYIYGTSATISATAVEHYHFLRWSDGVTTNPRSIVVEDDITLQALFAIDTHSVSITATDGGLTTGAGSYAYGSTATVIATPLSGYSFDGWMVNGNTVSTEATYTFTVEEDVTLTAAFTAYHNIILNSNNTTMGTVNEGGLLAENTVFTAVATANEGYRFVEWRHGAVAVCYDASYTFTVTNSITLTAIFEALPAEATYTVEVIYDETQGSVTGAGTYVEGTTVTLTATPKDGYRFLGWSTGDTNTTISITVISDMVITANFVNVGIDDVDQTDVNIYSAEGKIVIKGAEGSNIYVYDVNGRIVERKSNATDNVEFRMSTSGVYLVKVGNAPAKRVVVIR